MLCFYVQSLSFKLFIILTYLKGTFELSVCRKPNWFNRCHLVPWFAYDMVGNFTQKRKFQQGNRCREILGLTEIYGQSLSAPAYNMLIRIDCEQYSITNREAVIWRDSWWGSPGAKAVISLFMISHSNAVQCCHVPYLQNSQTVSLNLDVCEISHKAIPK